jgi:hypothetical protein
MILPLGGFAIWWFCRPAARRGEKCGHELLAEFSGWLAV